MKPHVRRQLGFSLYELMTGVALLAVMIAVIAPFASQVSSSAANANGHQNDVLSARRVMESIGNDVRHAAFTVHGPQKASVFTRDGRIDYTWRDGSLSRTAAGAQPTVLARRIASLTWQPGLNSLDVTLTLAPRRGAVGPSLRAVFAHRGDPR